MNENLLYSTGNSAQRSLVTFMGRKPKKEGIRVYNRWSLCCTIETTCKASSSAERPQLGESLGPVWLLATPWAAGHQEALSMGFSRQEHWSGWPFPSPGVFPPQGLNPCLLLWQVLYHCAPREAPRLLLEPWSDGAWHGQSGVSVQPAHSSQLTCAQAHLLTLCIDSLLPCIIFTLVSTNIVVNFSLKAQSMYWSKLDFHNLHTLNWNSILT